MWKYLVILLFLTPACFALQPLESSELESANVASGIIAPSGKSATLIRDPDNLSGNNDLSEARHRFKLEINKHIGKILSIYKEQLQVHNFPDVECVGFQFQITKDGVVRQVEADKVDITVENSEMVIKLIDFFKKVQFPSAAFYYSSPYKFCFNK